MSELQSNVQPTERIVWLDVWRGFALFGILVINITGFAWPMIYLESLKLPVFENGLDHLLETGINWLIQGKFYTLFSLLFGAGFYLFLQKAEQKGYSPRWLFIKRIMILIGFGLLNAFFLWWGDILLNYAVCGLFLVLFAKISARAMLNWAFVLVLILSLLMQFSVSMTQKAMDTGQAELIEQANEADRIELEAAYERSFVSYRSTSFERVNEQRVMDWRYLSGNLFAVPFVILPIFLIGAAIVKSGYLARLQQDQAFLRKVWLASLGIGVLFTALKEFSSANFAYGEFNSYVVGEFAFGWVGDLGLAIFYATSLLRLATFPKTAAFLMNLQWAGRMALTNYLMQAVFCTLIFYGPFLGLYGSVGMFGLLAFAVGIYALQVVYSKWWFARFSFGPAEWVWRKLTYGRLFNRREQPSDN